MEVSVEVGGSRLTSMGISMEVGGSRFTPMEVSASFHGNTWEFPLSVEVEASITSISFHEYISWKLRWASIVPYILPPTSTIITNFQLLPQDFHKGPPTSVRSISMEVYPIFHRNVHGKFHRNFHGNLHRSQWKNINFHGNFHGSWWK